MTSHRTIVTAVVLLTVAVLSVYGQVVGFEFVNVDDKDYVLRNLAVRDGLTLRGVSWAFTAFHSSNWHPVTWLSHMLDVELFGFSPAGHHGTNLLLHLANTLLLFTLLGKATGAWRRAFVVAALFALHPLNVESVAWVSERKNLLSTLFWLAALGAYGRYAASRRTADYLLMAGLFAMALMAKPMPVTLPITLLLLDVWPLGRLGAGAAPLWPRLRPLILEKLPLVPLSAAVSVLTLLAQSEGGAVRSLQQAGIADRLANAAIAYGGYLGKMVWPSDLSFFYPFSTTRISAGPLLLSLALVIGVTAGSLLLARRARYLPAGWGWYLVTLIPVIGIIQVGSQSMADRYAYVPLIGVFVMLVWGAADLAPKRGFTRLVLPAVTLAALVALGVVASGQARQWRSNTDLFSRLHGDQMAGIDPAEVSRMAMKGLEESIEQARRDPSPRRAFGVGLAMVQLRREDEALFWFREALRMDPDLAEAHGQVGDILLARGLVGEAAEEFSRAVALLPAYGEAHSRLGDSFSRLGRTVEARDEYLKAVELMPRDARSLNNLGAVLANLGEKGSAAGYFARAIEADPDYAPAHFNRGRALWEEGRRTEAAASLGEAVRLDPLSFSEPAAGITGGLP